MPHSDCMPPAPGKQEGDLHHSQPADTRMFVRLHHLFGADLIYLWPIYVHCSLHQRHISRLPSDSSAPSAATSGCPQLSPWAIAHCCLQPPSCDCCSLRGALSLCHCWISSKNVFKSCLLMETSLLHLTQYHLLQGISLFFSPSNFLTYLLCAILW